MSNFDIRFSKEVINDITVLVRINGLIREKKSTETTYFIKFSGIIEKLIN
jgi:hypothetical protein